MKEVMFGVDREDKGMVVFSLIMWIIILAWAAFAP
jgi:hypothetical protein